MAGLNVLIQMIEAIMYIGIGLLSGCLIGVAVVPPVHNRAVRLTSRRLEAVLPQSIEEVEAKKDLLRAQFAMSVRHLEIIVEQHRTKITSLLVELSRKSDAVNRLKIDRDRLRMQLEALKKPLAAPDEAATAKVRAGSVVRQFPNAA